jgi:hypothetical protein
LAVVAADEGGEKALLLRDERLALNSRFKFSFVAF